MNVYWLEQTVTDVPAENDWLTGNEVARLEALRFARRRSDWRLGRWTAKRAVATYLNLPGGSQALSTVEIRAAPSGAPEVYLAGESSDVTVSLSHRAGRAVCAVAPSGAALGCDLEVAEQHSDTFIADYFTSQEQAMVVRAPVPDHVAALLWSGKESTLKALRTGLRLDTRSVTVYPVGALPRQEEEGFAAGLAQVSAWSPLFVCCSDGRTFHGWWRHTSPFLRTLVAAPAPAPPILI